jgi:hypothetical protein
MCRDPLATALTAIASALDNFADGGVVDQITPAL